LRRTRTKSGGIGSIGIGIGIGTTTMGTGASGGGTAVRLTTGGLTGTVRIGTGEGRLPSLDHAQGHLTLGDATMENASTDRVESASTVPLVRDLRQRSETTMIVEVAESATTVSPVHVHRLDGETTRIAKSAESHILAHAAPDHRTLALAHPTSVSVKIA